MIKGGSLLKSVKVQFILSIITAFLFMINSLSYVEFTGIEAFLFPMKIMYFAMLVAVYNAGIMTQKYLQHKK